MPKRMSFAKVAILFALILILTSCIIPNNYECEMVFENRMYSIEYEGEFIVVPALQALIGPDGSKSENPRANQIAKEATAEFADAIKQEVARKDENGKCDISTKDESTLDADMFFESDYSLAKSYAGDSFMNVVEVKAVDDKTIKVYSRDINQRDKQGIKQLGLGDVNGELCIKTDGEVLETNAQKKPGMFSKCYKWDTDLDTPVLMVIRFKEPIG